jgi:hypothetical protein
MKANKFNQAKTSNTLARHDTDLMSSGIGYGGGGAYEADSVLDNSMVDDDDDEVGYRVSKLARI